MEAFLHSLPIRDTGRDGGARIMYPVPANPARKHTWHYEKDFYDLPADGDEEASFSAPSATNLFATTMTKLPR